MTRPISALVRLVCMMTTMVMTVPVVTGQEKAPEDPAPSAAEPAAQEDPGPPLNLETLLANPIPSHPELKYLYQRRSWLAANSTDTKNFLLLAQEFAEAGAYFPAIELAWFAEKMTDDGAEREDLQSRMRLWQKASAAATERVEKARQLFDADKSREALEELLKTLQDHPYAEKAHYELSNIQFRVYIKQAVSFENLMPFDMRTKLFRMLYEHLTCTIAIDPLFYDAYYLLSSIREILPEAKDFLVATEGLSEKALTFGSEVIPSMELIENGGRDPETFVAFGAGLETVGVMDYAVFAYQTALRRGSEDPEVPKRIEHLVQKYFRK